MFAVCVSTLLCWLAVSTSAAPSCEDLLQPLDRVDFQHLEGRWSMLAGSLSDLADVDSFKGRDNVIIAFANSSNSSEISMTRTYSVNGSCEYMNTNIVLEGSSFTFHHLNVTATFLKTSCDDCMVMKFDVPAKKRQRLYLFDRRGEVEQIKMEEFTAQAACLNMTSPILKDPTKMLCPEQRSISPTPQAEEKSH